MNKLLAATLFAAVGSLAFVPQTARAGGNETAAAVGGFIGGLIIGSALDNDRHHHHAQYEECAPVHVGARVVISTGPRYRAHDHGYWQWNSVRVWVPGRWVVRYDDCGRRIRYFERGHHEHRRERVWVSTGHHGRCDICR